MNVSMRRQGTWASYACAVLVALTVGCERKVSEPHADTVRPEALQAGAAILEFEARVAAVCYIGQFEGTIVYDGGLAEFVVTLCVTRTLEAQGLKEGDTLNCAVHSIVLTFGVPEDELGDQQFRIKLRRPTSVEDRGTFVVEKVDVHRAE